jgi:hypothetical protein
VFGLATVLLGYDLQGWITLIAGILLALITLFTGLARFEREHLSGSIPPPSTGDSSN